MSRAWKCRRPVPARLDDVQEQAARPAERWMPQVHWLELQWIRAMAWASPGDDCNFVLDELRDDVLAVADGGTVVARATRRATSCASKVELPPTPREGCVAARQRNPLSQRA